jgi:bacteriocin biosynthesis cyclodehydratase domain-containing protein
MRPDNQEASLSDWELEYYSRQIVLRDVGYSGQMKLKGAHVSLIGMGGLGNPIATQLTAMGVGHLRIVDRDVVERSNLQRQHLYDVEHLGYPKVEVAAKKLRKLNPAIEIEPLTVSINSESALGIVKDSDVVLDGLDRMSTRYILNEACVDEGIPYIFGGAIMDLGNVSTIIPGKTPCLECFYGNLSDERTQTCAVLGIHPSVLGITASIEVSEAIRIIIGKEPRLQGKLLYCDLGNMSFDQISLVRRNDCPVCGEHPSRRPKAQRETLVEEICGRNLKRTFAITPRKDLELDIEGGTKKIVGRGLKVKTKARLGVTFDYEEKVEISILKSGSGTIVGAEGTEEALRIYKGVLTEMFGVSQNDAP